MIDTSGEPQTFSFFFVLTAESVKCQKISESPQIYSWEFSKCHLSSFERGLSWLSVPRVMRFCLSRYLPLCNPLSHSLNLLFLLFCSFSFLCPITRFISPSLSGGILIHLSVTFVFTYFSCRLHLITLGKE